MVYIVKNSQKNSLIQKYGRLRIFFFIKRNCIHKAVKNDYNDNVSDLLKVSFEHKNGCLQSSKHLQTHYKE